LVNVTIKYITTANSVTVTVKLLTSNTLCFRTFYFLDNGHILSL